MNLIQNIDKLYLAIFLFIILYLLINIIKPNFIFNKQENCLRDFGIGYKNTSILSLWIVTIILAIFSYFIVIYIFHLQNRWF